MLTHKILVVDDEEDICEILKFNLQDDNTVVNTLHSAEDALKEDLNTYNLILLDVMMNGLSGFQLADKLRNNLNIDTPIIFITAKDTENDMLTGFNLGGDDYISKPFSIKEVSARVKAVLKRQALKLAKTDEQEKHIIVGDMQINTENKTVKINNVAIKLTKKEYEILVLLISKNGKLISREEILEQVWKEDGYVSSRTIDVHIARLRKKIEQYGTYIKNRSGFGYCFSSEE
jgi:two-component system alkaline phosphatase synthesis response regulator PhoP